MLKVMRDSFHHLKWVLIAVVVAFIFGFVFIDMGMGGAPGVSETAEFAAKVNGDTITLPEFDRAMYYAEENYKQIYGGQFTPEMAEAMGLKKQVLGSLVDQELLLQEAERLNLNASPEEIRAKIRTIPLLNPDGKFVGAELYHRYITRVGYRNAADFEEALAREITLEKMESALRNAVVVSPKAAEAEYRRISENAKIRYVLYPTAREAAAVTVTPAEIEAFYKANQPKYTHTEQRQVKYLLAETNRLRNQNVPSEALLRQRYESTRESYKRPDAAKVLHILVKVEPNAAPEVDAAAKAKAEGLVAQLRGGADFATLARLNSDDPSSAGNGGDMGFVERGQTVPSFEQAIFSLPLNQVSDAIRSPEYGYHIVKVTERRPPGYRSFEEVRAELSSQVAEQMAKDQARDEVARVSAQMRTKKPATAEEFAAYANDKLTSNDTGWFQKTDQIPGLGHNPVVTTWAFTAKKGDVGEPIGTSRGAIVPYLADIRPAGVPPLNEIRAKVDTDARMAKARDVARQALATAMAGAANVDTIAAKIGLSAAEATVSRQGFVAGLTGDTTALVEAAMAANLGEIKGPVLVGEGAVAFEVKEQKKVTPQELAENRDQYLDSLRQQEARNLRRVLLERLRKTSKVEENETLTKTAERAPA